MYSGLFERILDDNRCKFVWLQFVDENGGLRSTLARLISREHPYGKFTLPRGEVFYVELDKIHNITSAEVPA
jgi:hypothetical protein